MTDHARRSAGHHGNDEPQQYAGFHDPAGPPPPPPYAPAYAPDAPAASVTPVARRGSGTRHRRRAGRPVGLIAAVAVAAAALGGGAGALVQDLTTDATAATSTGAAGTAGTAGTAVSQSGTGTVAGVARAVSPSVVEIRAASGSGQSTGSGVIITADGEVVTNNHVVAGASEVEVRLTDGTTHTADVIGTAPAKDLALVKLRGARGLKAAVLGDSSAVRVGDQVVAIGSPEGLTSTVTSGIVSALDRDVTVAKEEDGSGGTQRGDWPFEYGGQRFNGDTGSSKTTYKAIQTDASLNPGNSGGALIDMKGEVIGINSAMYAPSTATGSSSGGTGSVGLGFAIPIDTLKAELDALRGD
ncbi:trypsin-like peptidase domain-containing protein [Streptomyces sp. TRM76323]|uniref:Trypsin-like peptidase domain-containing protein n=1 Tax=Streptomyces tamarix TaxID=3078565 RepID=A0ABU3QRN9_9ACTN|nr:trypsin-like peptidase domain-containing protein [Streptomyces tamarix]MDT9685198.1 trypsin-like peptidase domain-containing protein [Streptomyces tamarix]